MSGSFIILSRPRTGVPLAVASGRRRQLSPSRTAKIVTLLVLALILTASGMISASAFAANPVWEKCSNVGLRKGLFKDNTCSSIGGNREYKKIARPAGVQVNIKTGVSTGTTYRFYNATLEIRCKTLKNTLGISWIENPTGGGRGIDKLWAEFSNCELVGHPACTVAPETLHAVSSELTFVGVRVVDREGGIGFRIGIKECAQEQEVELTGELDAEVGPSGELIFPELPIESNLKLGGESATFTGTFDEETESGEVIEAGDKETEEAETKEQEKVEKAEERFTGTSGRGTLKAGAESVICGKDTSSGELTSTMLFSDVVIHFLECKSTGSGGSNCSVHSTNTTSEGLILTTTLRAIVGLVLPSRGAGLLLLPISGKTWETLAGNTCTEETTVTGTLAGLITPTGKSETTSKIAFSTSSGKQEIKDIDTLAGLIEPKLTMFTAIATEETTEEITWGKAIEVP
jgi:hypothetical protein